MLALQNHWIVRVWSFSFTQFKEIVCQKNLLVVLNRYTDIYYLWTNEQRLKEYIECWQTKIVALGYYFCALHSFGLIKALNILFVLYTLFELHHLELL